MISSSTLQTWLPILAPVATVAAAAVASIPLYRQLKLKREEDKGLSEASRAEMDARLLAVFVQLMGKAQARGETTVVDSAIQAIISSGGPLAPDSLDALKALIQAAVVTYPVGLAEVEAAMVAVGELGARYELLRQPALAGLQQLTLWNPMSKALQAAIGRLDALSPPDPQGNSPPG